MHNYDALNHTFRTALILSLLFVGGCSTFQPPPPPSCEDNGEGMRMVNTPDKYPTGASYHADNTDQHSIGITITPSSIEELENE